MTNPSLPRSKPFFFHIDGLRGVAVLSVLIFHLRNSWLPGGFLGVDMFFVISGFVVSHSVRDFQGSFVEFILEFYRRRVLRILPPLIVCLCLTAILCVIFIPGDQTVFSRVSRAAHFAMSNFTMIKENANYFSPTADFHPLTHTWSLGVEEQFYLFFPFLFFFLVLKPLRNLTGISGFLGIIAASLLYSISHRDNTTTNFYGFLPRMWELSIGVVAYLASDSFASENSSKMLSSETRRKSLFALCALALAIASTFQQAIEGLSLWQAAAALSTGLLLFLLRAPCSDAFWVKRLLSIQPLRWTGRISYSLYLFHWPVIVVLRWTLGMDSPESVLAATGLSFGLGALCYYQIERPMKAFSHTTWARRPRPALALGLALLVASSVITSGVYSQHQKFSLSVVSKNSSDWTTGAEFLASGCLVQTSSENGATVYRRGKTLSDRHSESNPDPVCPENTSSKRLFVVGDSHAGAYSILLKKLAEQDVSSAHLFTRPGCTTFNLIGSGDGECNSFIEKTFLNISKTATSEDVLFLPGLRFWRLTDYHANPVQEATPESFQRESIISLHRALVERSLAILTPLLDRGMTILIESPKPLFKISAFRCADTFNQNNPLCRWGFIMNRDELLNYLKTPHETLRSIADQHPNIHLWDPFPVLCPKTSENTCSALRGCRPLFYDYDHLSPYGNEILYPHFLSYLTEAKAQD